MEKLSDPRPLRKVSKKLSDNVLSHFRIRVPRKLEEKEMEVTLCALCCNSGIIELPEHQTRFETVVPARQFYCMCPNGREDARKAKSEIPEVNSTGK